MRARRDLSAVRWGEIRRSTAYLPFRDVQWLISTILDSLNVQSASPTSSLRLDMRRSEAVAEGEGG